ncbi:MAG: HD domain-containing protein, partial [Raoultibacter sp.]
SGEPYITHPVAVARILAELGLDVETLIAAILHDTIEDTPLTGEELAAEFGQAVADLVEGVTKLDKLKFRDRQEAAAESFRKMLLAMSRDLRVIMIKLADRLHNMRTLGAQSAEARRRIATETLDIYAPIAQRLGMNLIKSELQNL